MDFNSAGDHLCNHWVREMFMREAQVDTAYGVQPLDLIRAQMRIQRTQVIFQLLELTRAYENGCHRRLGEEPGECYLRRRLLNLGGHFLYLVHDLHVSFGK